MNDSTKAIAAALVTAASSVFVSANSITVTELSAVNVGGGSQWAYDLSFINSTLNNGDFITINDFGPGAVVVSPNSGWIFSQSLVGPNSLPAIDDPAQLNATLTWTGGNGVVLSPDPASVHNQSLTLSSPRPVAATIINSDYTTIDQVSSGLVAGTDSKVFGSVATPTTGPGIPTVPDSSSTLALSSFALASLSAFRRTLRR